MEFNKETFEKALKANKIVRYQQHFEAVVKSYLEIENQALRQPPVIRRRHKWDNPKNSISAICVKCGCRRFAEKFSGRMSWIYLPKGKVVELTNVPACL